MSVAKVLCRLMVFVSSELFLEETIQTAPECSYSCNGIPPAERDFSLVSRIHYQYLVSPSPYSSLY